MLVSKLFAPDDINKEKNPFRRFEMQLNRIPEQTMESLDDIQSIKISIWNHPPAPAVSLGNVFESERSDDKIQEIGDADVNDYLLHDEDIPEIDKMLCEMNESDPSFKIDSFFENTFPESQQQNTKSLRERYFDDLAQHNGDESKIDRNVLNVHRAGCVEWLDVCSKHIDRNVLHPYQLKIKAHFVSVSQYADLAHTINKRRDDHGNTECLQFAFPPIVGKNPVTYTYDIKFSKIVECVLAMKRTAFWVQLYGGTIQEFAKIQEVFVNSWDALGKEDTPFHYYLRWLQYESKGIHVPDYLPSAQNHLLEFVKTKQDRYHQFLAEWKRTSTDPRHAFYHTFLYMTVRPVMIMAKHLQIVESLDQQKITFKFIFAGESASKNCELSVPPSHSQLIFTLILLYNSPLYFTHRSLDEFEYLFDIYEELVVSLKRLVSTLGK